MDLRTRFSGMLLLATAAAPGCATDQTRTDGPLPPAAPREVEAGPAREGPVSETPAPPSGAAASRVETLPGRTGASGPVAGTCTFDVVDLGIDKVLDYVRRASGVGIQVQDEARAAKVTLRVWRLPWRTTLDELGLQIGCIVEEHPEGLRLGMARAEIELWEAVASLEEELRNVPEDSADADLREGN